MISVMIHILKMTHIGKIKPVNFAVSKLDMIRVTIRNKTPYLDTSGGN